MTIDVHTHFHSRGLDGAAGEPIGPRLATDKSGRSVWKIGQRLQNAPRAIFDLEERLRLMDAARIDIQVLANSPKWFLYNFIHTGVSRETCISFARAQNNDLIAATRAHPDRFAALATLPFLDMRASVEELSRAIDSGIKGVIIDSVVNGAGLDDEALFPIYERIQKEQLVLFVHPSFLNDPRVERPGFRWMIGFAFDETYAIACLVFGGVLDAFPTLKIVVSHGGGAMPFLLGRFEKGADRPDLISKAKFPFAQYLKRLHYDACTYNAEALQFLVRIVGEDNVVFGTNFPGSPDLSSKLIDSATSLSQIARQKILHHNAQRLFNL